VEDELCPLRLRRAEDLGKEQKHEETVIVTISVPGLALPVSALDIKVIAAKPAADNPQNDNKELCPTQRFCSAASCQAGISINSGTTGRLPRFSRRGNGTVPFPNRKIISCSLPSGQNQGEMRSVTRRCTGTCWWNRERAAGTLPENPVTPCRPEELLHSIRPKGVKKTGSRVLVAASH